MHRSDIGSFGVATVVLTLPLQVSCLAALLEVREGRPALWTAVVVARMAMARTGVPGVATAEGSALGALAAGTVSVPWFTGWIVVLLVLLVAGRGLDPQPATGLALSALADLVAAELLVPQRPEAAGWRDRRRDGQDGDRGHPARGRDRPLDPRPPTSTRPGGAVRHRRRSTPWTRRPMPPPEAGVAARPRPVPRPNPRPAVGRAMPRLGRADARPPRAAFPAVPISLLRMLMAAGFPERGHSIPSTALRPP